MSVIPDTWKEIGASRSGGKGSNLARSYTRIWRVETDTVTDEASVVLAYSEVPVPLSSVYPTDSAAICYEVDCRQEVEDDFKCWIVTAKYSTIPPQTPGQFDTSNPLLDAVQYSFSTDTFQEVARQALLVDTATGNTPLASQVGPLTNSLGETFRPGIEVDRARGIYTARKKFAYVDPTILALADCVNITPWRSCAARTVKCVSINSGDVQQRNNINYYEVVAQFAYKPETWDLRPLNLSTLYKTGAGKIIQIEPGSEPVVVYNDQASAPWTKVPRGTHPNPNDIYLRYRYFTEVDFYAFGF